MCFYNSILKDESDNIGYTVNVLILEGIIKQHNNKIIIF